MVKLDGVFFGDPIHSDAARKSLEEAMKCDLMLICGSSAVVCPFANLLRMAGQRLRDGERRSGVGRLGGETLRAVTVIEVNAQPTPLMEEGISDFLIPGKTGEILPKIMEAVKMLRAWKEN